jgi:hypothetical protein
VQPSKERFEPSLDTYIYAYNTSKHESSKYTPFEVMFGRRNLIDYFSTPASFINGCVVYSDEVEFTPKCEKGPRRVLDLLIGLGVRNADTLQIIIVVKHDSITQN